MFKTTIEVKYHAVSDDKVMELVREFTAKLAEIGVECKGDQITTQASEPA